MFKNLKKHKFNVYSQNGEDGILQYIFNKLSIKKGFAVEFGAADGIWLSNTYNLVKNGWKAVYIESDKESFSKLEELSKSKNLDIIALNKTVSPDSGKNNLNTILSKLSVPDEFELLSIDVDGLDLEIWESFLGNPIVVVIEINSGIYPGKLQNHSKQNSGASFTSMVEIGEKKGYKVVCHTGNLIFLKKEYVNKIDISKLYLNYPNLIFDKNLNRKYKLNKLISKLKKKILKS